MSLIIFSSQKEHTRIRGSSEVTHQCPWCLHTPVQEQADLMNTCCNGPLSVHHTSYYLIPLHPILFMCIQLQTLSTFNVLLKCLFFGEFPLIPKARNNFPSTRKKMHKIHCINRLYFSLIEMRQKIFLLIFRASYSLKNVNCNNKNLAIIKLFKQNSY